MASSLAGSRNQAPARNHWQQTCTGCRAIHQHCGGRSHSGGPCARCARRGIRCVFPGPPAVLPSRNCPTNELYAGSSSGVARNWIQPSVVTIPSGVAPSPPTGAHCLPQAHGAGHSLEPPNGAGGLWQNFVTPSCGQAQYRYEPVPSPISSASARGTSGGHGYDTAWASLFPTAQSASAARGLLGSPQRAEDAMADFMRFQRHILLAVPGSFRIVFEVEGGDQAIVNLQDAPTLNRGGGAQAVRVESHEPASFSNNGVSAQTIVGPRGSTYLAAINGGNAGIGPTFTY